MDQIVAIKMGVATLMLGVCVSLSAACGYIPELLAELAFYLGLTIGVIGLVVASLATEEEYLWRNGRRVATWKC